MSNSRIRRGNHTNKQRKILVCVIKVETVTDWLPWKWMPAINKILLLLFYMDTCLSVFSTTDADVPGVAAAVRETRLNTGIVSHWRWAGTGGYLESQYSEPASTHRGEHGECFSIYSRYLQFITLVCARDFSTLFQLHVVATTEHLDCIWSTYTFPVIIIVFCWNRLCVGCYLHTL